MAASMHHKTQMHAVSSSMKQQLAPMASRPVHAPLVAPATRQQQQQQHRVLQLLQAVATSHSQPLRQQHLPQLQQQLQQQQQQQARLQRRRRVLVVFAVPADASEQAGDEEGGLDPNIPAVDQDFDLLGAEVRGTQGGRANSSCTGMQQKHHLKLVFAYSS